MDQLFTDFHFGMLLWQLFLILILIVVVIGLVKLYKLISKNLRLKNQ